jgi:hypothetical protein
MRQWNLRQQRPRARLHSDRLPPWSSRALPAYTHRAIPKGLSRLRAMASRIASAHRALHNAPTPPPRRALDAGIGELPHPQADLVPLLGAPTPTHGHVIADVEGGAEPFVPGCGRSVPAGWHRCPPQEASSKQRPQVTSAAPVSGLQHAWVVQPAPPPDRPSRRWHIVHKSRFAWWPAAVAAICLSTSSRLCLRECCGLPLPAQRRTRQREGRPAGWP